MQENLHHLAPASISLSPQPINTRSLPASPSSRRFAAIIAHIKAIEHCHREDYLRPISHAHLTASSTSRGNPSKDPVTSPSALCFRRRSTTPARLRHATNSTHPLGSRPAWPSLAPSPPKRPKALPALLTHRPSRSPLRIRSQRPRARAPRKLLSLFPTLLGANHCARVKPAAPLRSGIKRLPAPASLQGSLVITFLCLRPRLLTCPRRVTQSRGSGTNTPDPESIIRRLWQHHSTPATHPIALLAPSSPLESLWSNSRRRAHRRATSGSISASKKRHWSPSSWLFPNLHTPPGGLSLPDTASAVGATAALSIPPLSRPESRVRPSQLCRPLSRLDWPFGAPPPNILKPASRQPASGLPEQLYLPQFFQPTLPTLDGPRHRPFNQHQTKQTRALNSTLGHPTRASRRD